MQIVQVRIVKVNDEEHLNDLLRRHDECPGQGAMITGCEPWDRTIFGRVKTVAVYYKTNVAEPAG